MYIKAKSYDNIETNTRIDIPDDQAVIDGTGYDLISIMRPGDI